MSDVIRFQLLRPGARLPERAHPDDVGFDVFCVERVAGVVGDVIEVPLGFACEPPPGVWLQIAPRSGLARRGVAVLGGVIDPGYRGEVKALLALVGEFATLNLPAGSRVAQLVPHASPRLVAAEAKELSGTARGSGGFGSTGR